MDGEGDAFLSLWHLGMLPTYSTFANNRQFLHGDMGFISAKRIRDRSFPTPASLLDIRDC